MGSTYESERDDDEFEGEGKGEATIPVAPVESADDVPRLVHVGAGLYIKVTRTDGGAGERGYKSRNR